MSDLSPARMPTDRHHGTPPLIDPASGARIVYRLRGVAKTYPSPVRPIQVLRDLDLDVAAGDFLVIEGKSGIGKTTLLHIMGLLDRPDSGVLDFEGEDVGRASSGRRAALRAERVTFVFQFYHLLPEFTAAENVLLPSMITHGLLSWRAEKKKFVERARRLLELVGVGHRATHRPKHLSGGERQRVALARALFNQPAVVLCDEPTGNLDVRTTDEIHELLVRLNAETGQTFVVVTHDPGLADMAKRVVRLEDGKLSERGPATLAPPAE
jgi:lipoprotein-releasing system ATP-binding protein